MTTTTLSQVVETSLYIPKSEKGIGRSNKKSSYISLFKTLNEKENIVFAAIYLGYNSPYEISKFTGLCIRTVGGRLTDLKKGEYISEIGKTLSPHGKMNTVFEIAEQYKNIEVEKDDLISAISEYKKVLEAQKSKYYTIEQIQDIMMMNSIDTSVILKIKKDLQSIQ